MIGYFEFLESVKDRTPMPTLDDLEREYEELWRDLPYQEAPSDDRK